MKNEYKIITIFALTLYTKILVAGEQPGAKFSYVPIKLLQETICDMNIVAGDTLSIIIGYAQSKNWVCTAKKPYSEEYQYYYYKPLYCGDKYQYIRLSKEGGTLFPEVLYINAKTLEEVPSSHDSIQGMNTFYSGRISSCKYTLDSDKILTYPKLPNLYIINKTSTKPSVIYWLDKSDKYYKDVNLFNVELLGKNKLAYIRKAHDSESALVVENFLKNPPQRKIILQDANDPTLNFAISPDENNAVFTVTRNYLKLWKEVLAHEVTEK